MQQTPKPYINKFKLRHHAYGTELRRNMSKIILEKGTILPKPIQYSDIDEAMYEWVDKKMDLSYDGKRLSTYKLYSTQRISEYIQTWKGSDETNSLELNFKTVTREFNPQKGEIQGNYFNIPGHKNFAMFYVPVLEENGVEAYDRYTMKQPFGVNLLYSVSIVSNKMELINLMNEKMLYEFSAINCYISPNGHPMSMSLDEISDNSEYTIDDRKYYSQTYKIKVRGYIIREEDYEVERVPSRIVMSSHDSDASGKVYKRGKNRDMKVKFIHDDIEDSEKYIDVCNTPLNQKDKERHVEIYEETSDTRYCCDEGAQRYTNKLIKFIIDFEECLKEVSFICDKEAVMTEVETENVYDFKLFINDELMDLDNEIKFFEGDKIDVKISRDNDFKSSKLTLVAYDPNESIDNEHIAESPLDDEIGEEDIYVDKEEKQR